LLAPVLGIALALLLAGAINSIMIPTANDTKTQSFGPEPTHEANPLPTHPPVAMATSGGPVSPFLFIAGAVIVGVLAVLLFFREKSLNKTLSE
jgi:hypothetical protein